MTQQALPPTAALHPVMEIDHAQIRRDMLVRRIGRFAFFLNPIVSYFFLWAPIVMLVIYSFNDSKTISVWGGLTVDWYANMFAADNEFSRNMLDSVRNSLFIGIASMLISTTLGTMVALSLERGRFPGKRILDGLLYLPVVIPEITQAVSLAVFFKSIFDIVNSTTGANLTYGYGTIIIGHVVFSISFVTITVRARLADMNPRWEEAARDLGANEWRTFWRVTFPLILPGVVSGALLAFTLSLDDYIVTFFNNGVGTSTLPIFVYSSLRQRVSPEINAVSTLMLVASMILVGFSLAMQNRGASRT